MVALTPIEQIALACLIKPDDVKELKRSLPPGSNTVDFTVRVNGTITKAPSTPDSSGFADPTMDLRSIHVVCAVLRQLGIGTGRLMDALAVVPNPEVIVADEKMLAVFAAEEAKRVARMAKVPITTPGRSGNTSVLATATKIVAKGKR